MAFPVIEATAESSTNTAGTNHAVTLPASIAASDLVLIVMDIGSTSATLNALTGWTEILDEASANGLKILYYTGVGVPTNPTFVSSASTRDASISFRISGVNKTITAQIGTTGTGTSATPDPPTSAAPSSTKDYLFIAFAGMAGEEADDDTWANTPPTNYTPNPPLQKSCGTAGTNLGGLICAASRQLNTGSAEDPGTFGVDVSAAWRSQTIMVHPILATTATPGVLALAITTFAPTVTHTDAVRVTPSVLASSISTFAPQLKLSVIPSKLSLAVNGIAPTVGLGIITSVSHLTLSGLAPRLDLATIPPAATVGITGFEPTINITGGGSGVTVTTNTGSVTISGQVPVLNLGIVPAATSITITSFVPGLGLTGNITAGLTSLTMSAFAPSVNIGGTSSARVRDLMCGLGIIPVRR